MTLLLLVRFAFLSLVRLFSVLVTLLRVILVLFLMRLIFNKLLRYITHKPEYS